MAQLIENYGSGRTSFTGVFGQSTKQSSEVIRKSAVLTPKSPKSFQLPLIRFRNAFRARNGQPFLLKGGFGRCLVYPKQPPPRPRETPELKRAHRSLVG